MSRRYFNFFLSGILLFICHTAFAQEFVSPVGAQEALSIDKDSAKYYLIKPGQELFYKIKGPTTIKVYGRILNPAKSGNASLMVNQGNLLVGAMLITPKISKDLLKKRMTALSQVSVQEFNISEGEQQIRIRSSAKSPEVIVAVEVMNKRQAEQSIDLIPLVPLAPLVPPKEEEKTEGIELVPLVPLTKADTKAAKKEENVQIAAPPKGQKQERYREIAAKPVDTPTKKPISGITTVVETSPKAEIGKRVFSSTATIGTILPLQSIGGPYLNADILFNVYPVKSNPALGTGIKAGFYSMNINLKDGMGNLMYTMNASIMPFSLLLSYSIPLSPRLVSDFSFGGGIALVLAELNGKNNRPSRSESSVPFLFELGGALSYKIDRNNSIVGRIGFLGGKTSTNFVSDLYTGGLTVSCGYSFTF